MCCLILRQLDGSVVMCPTFHSWLYMLLGDRNKFALKVSWQLVFSPKVTDWSQLADQVYCKAPIKGSVRVEGFIFHFGLATNTGLDC